MTLFRAGGRILYLAHIPKTGGTTISVALRESGATQALHFSRRVGGMRCAPQHFHDDLLGALVSAEFYDEAMTVVRNPYGRMVSEYRYRLGLERDLEPFAQWVVRAIEGFRENPFVYDNHIRPQSAFVNDDMTLFRFEDGLSRPVEHAVAVLGTRMPTIAHHKRSEVVPVRTSDTTVELIREFYADDFRRFGYDPDDVPALLRD